MPYDTPPKAPVDIVFSERTKAVQERKGSRRGYAHIQMSDEISPDLRAFIGTRTSFYLGTAGADGQPYIQHRGGPPGFLRVLDHKTLAFADFSGNRQYISTGNLEENPKVYLFLMDYAHRQRIKIWGEAEVIENDDALTQELMPDGYRARPEQVMKITVTAWDANCPQHIPQMFEATDVAAALQEKDARIKELESQLANLT